MSADDAANGEIRRVRLADQAYQALRTRISERRLGAGDHLSVPALADELGLSRSPVREAVQRLVGEGLATERAHRGAVLVGRDPDDIAALYAVRESLEGLAAALASERRTTGLETDLDRLVEEHAAAIRAGEESEVIAADLRLHARILTASGNPHLERALSPIYGRIPIATLSGNLAAWPRKSVTEHRAIVRAVASGQAHRAATLARAHVMSLRRRLTRRVPRRGAQAINAWPDSEATRPG